ncbi:MAG TPA: hydantoinase B/oxoprolinase family protein [Sphingomonas sanguinis]|uniref:hydantoinase B/oxoprolinase family protein n=1 Tax=Sphingomonas sanguinis TaxID=33051 RepID=UPI002AC19AE5|nr:hydantoinase B/oxoprolinase family protein [Sphingomonas sanguinis]HJO65652.1 hydantoinase B/oxoprolinase family protein [Sphingomonas sanguinis]
MQEPVAQWQFWIDRGGTFTDVVARRPDGTLVTTKLLSEDPERRYDAAEAAIRQLTGVGDGPLPPCAIRIGTTIATNALLERQGEPVLLAITRGFGDALTIGYQDRPDIFARDIRRPAPLFAEVVEIDERVAEDGRVLTPLDRDGAAAAFAQAYARGLRSIAIVLMHGWKHQAHELALVELAEAAGFTQISVSHRTAPLIRLVARGDTTLADAYLSPVLRRYVRGLEDGLGGAADGGLLFMQSSGGLVAGEHFHGKDALLSGPAGGIVGMARTARGAGFDRIIGFDMGGTSTDVSLYAGQYDRRSDAVLAGVRVAVPMMRIDTVAAGGGSICHFDGGRLLVGPASAGAEPGPACYRRGGPLTVTDCNMILGKIQPEHFPALFGPNRNLPPDRAAAERALDALLDEVAAAGGERLDPMAAAEGLVAIAVANMARAIRAVSVARGEDPASYALACFGGAGGQHACLVADALGMERVLIHPLAGVLSAVGIGLADRSVVREATIALPLGDDALLPALEALREEAKDGLAEQGVDPATIRFAVLAQLRYARNDQTIGVAWGSPESMAQDFAAAHHQRFGFVGDDRLVVEQLRVEAIAGDAAQALPTPAPPDRSAEPIDRVAMYLAGERHDVPVYRREGLAAAAVLTGPVLIIDPVSTVVVEPGWQARVLAEGTLLLERVGARREWAAEEAVDPVRLEIFAGLFMGIAEEMGAALQRSAASVNIRERLDFSCALFDADGGLVANAPHIPVHLGSMGESIRTVIRARSGAMREGQVYALNDPYRGGTHLPDITVIMPVFAGGETPTFFVAARGHHADVGGTTPGSMPPDSRTLAEEGVVFDDVLIVEDGAMREHAIRDLLASGPYPARNIDQNIADLAAQVAACARGAEGLRQLAAQQGQGVVTRYMAHIQAHAEAMARRMIATLSDGTFRYALDDGAVVAVRVTIDAVQGHATIDFTGTSEQRPTNFNAPLAVTRAAVLYVLRLLVDEAVPLNEGFLRPVTLIVPEGSMLNPHFPAAVVAGNVEVSQVVTDTLLGALGAMAGSQGTMNNLTFGDDSYQYYETIAGGAGAGPDHHGADAIQTHMTNSRLTDPEVLETRYPVLVEQFAIRRGSGGAARHRGGDGTHRRIRFLRPLRAAILSNRRVVPPFGLNGGGAGQAGLNRVERADGTSQDLASTAGIEMKSGDVLVIETPGGGGYGAEEH